VDFEGKQPVKVNPGQSGIPLEITLSLPGGEETASYLNGSITHQSHSVDSELKVYGRMASFMVPEGEKLEVSVKVPDSGEEIAFQLVTSLEANEENGLEKYQQPLSSARKILKPGESARFLIDNRKAGEVRSNKSDH
jgi:hypothetical protein